MFRRGHNIFGYPKFQVSWKHPETRWAPLPTYIYVVITPISIGHNTRYPFVRPCICSGWYCWWFRNPKQPPGMYKTYKTPVNNGRNYQPQQYHSMYNHRRGWPPWYICCTGKPWIRMDPPHSQPGEEPRRLSVALLGGWMFQWPLKTNECSPKKKPFPKG